MRLYVCKRKTLWVISVMFDDVKPQVIKVLVHI